MDLKELKKLAAACRKAGISHFKSEQYEFTLTEDQPVSAYKQAKITASNSDAQVSGDTGKFQSDSLTDDELLFWSVDKSSQLIGNTEDKG